MSLGKLQGVGRARLRSASDASPMRSPATMHLWASPNLARPRDTLAAMPRRLVALAFLAAAAATFARLLSGEPRPARPSGNGHSPDPHQRDVLRRRIETARARVRDGIDQLRGGE
jgi:hypothetical protein